jgi:hypothetical protein
MMAAIYSQEAICASWIARACRRGRRRSLLRKPRPSLTRSILISTRRTRGGTPGPAGRPARTLKGSSFQKSIPRICSGSSASSFGLDEVDKHSFPDAKRAEVLGGRGEGTVCSASPPERENRSTPLPVLLLLATRMRPARHPTGTLRGARGRCPDADDHQGRLRLLTTSQS